MSENYELVSNDLSTNEDNLVDGMGIVSLDNEYDVLFSVSSYEFNGNRQNHVPNATLVDESGKIIREITDHDTENPQTAIERAKNSAYHLADNYEQYI